MEVGRGGGKVRRAKPCSIGQCMLVGGGDSRGGGESPASMSIGGGSNAVGIM